MNNVIKKVEEFQSHANAFTSAIAETAPSIDDANSSGAIYVWGDDARIVLSDEDTPRQFIRSRIEKFIVDYQDVLDWSDGNVNNDNLESSYQWLLRKYGLTDTDETRGIWNHLLSVTVDEIIAFIGELEESA